MLTATVKGGYNGLGLVIFPCIWPPTDHSMKSLFTRVLYHAESVAGHHLLSHPTDGLCIFNPAQSQTSPLGGNLPRKLEKLGPISMQYFTL